MSKYGWGGSTSTITRAPGGYGAYVPWEMYTPVNPFQYASSPAKSSKAGGFYSRKGNFPRGGGPPGGGRRGGGYGIGAIGGGGRRRFRFRLRRKGYRRRNSSKYSRPSRRFTNKVRKVLDKAEPWVVYNAMSSGQIAATPNFEVIHDWVSGYQTDITTILGANMLNLTNAGTSGITQGIEVNRCRFELNLQNNTNYPQQLKLYYGKPRFSHGINMSSAYYQGLGPSYLGNTAVTDSTHIPYGSMPFDVPYFTTYWKIYKTKTMTLEPGMGHRFHLKARNLEGTFHSSDRLIEQSTVNLQAFTNGLMVQVRPFAAHDASTKTTVGQTTPLLDYMLLQQFKARRLTGFGAANKNTYSDGRGQPATATILQNEGGISATAADA